ncbi:unnamed protein product [Arabidopsis arenosa]|uniref:Uncharacterized protein n=1 Tax=Arabidopsis arenosa TaxID=38785 RepID=A0A8S1ZI52_ARAAE|nr:unnamed protein product [Arabidopsis arenosa]
MDNDVFQIRRSMRDAIFVLLEKKNPLPTDDASKAKCLDAVAKRLEELLFKMAMTKEEYLNPSTLESRLKSLIIGRQSNNYNQQHATPGVSAEPTMDNGNRDQYETEIAENLKSVSLALEP